MPISGLIFPSKCLGCNKPGSYLCPVCLQKVEAPKPVCPNCYKPAIDGATHQKCKRKLGLDGLIALREYKGVIKKAVGALKFRYASEVANDIFTNTFNQIPNWLVDNVDIVLPVPMHPKHLRQRGFNQAEILAALVGQGLNKPHVSDMVIKLKDTISQTKLDGKERRVNLRGSFGWNKKYKLEKDLCAVIVDDVYTTGSTVKEVAKILKRNGFEKVWGLTIAK